MGRGLREGLSAWVSHALYLMLPHSLTHSALPHSPAHPGRPEFESAALQIWALLGELHGSDDGLYCESIEVTIKKSK